MTSLLLSIAVLSPAVHSFFRDEILEIQTASRQINPKQYLTVALSPDTAAPKLVDGSSPRSLKGGDTGTLSVSPQLVTSDTEWVTVSWANISYSGKYDWIGLFNASAASVSYAAPPLKFQYICPALNGCRNAPSSGSLRFQILNRRTEYVFAYITESNPFREIKGVSPVISFPVDELYRPMNVHIATVTGPLSRNCGATFSCLQVMWIQKETAAPMVRYGVVPQNLDSKAKALEITKLSASDLCGQQYGLPAGTAGFFETGHMVTAYLLSLRPGSTYFYQVGDAEYGWTETFNFTAPPKHGSMPRFPGGLKMILFGDLGNVAIDYSFHHSWDFGNRGEIYSINTTRTVHRFSNGELDRTDAVVHIGDISYAVGYLSEWDDFFHQIQPTAAHVPWMTGIGNHEYGWNGQWNPPSKEVNPDAYGTGDGGGECGVPYNFYFPFANSNQAASRKAKYDPTVVEPWYVFDFGTVRCIVLSTEHDFGRDSAQFVFLNETLSATDRSLFPWVFVAGHRPMYANDDWDGDTSTSEYMRDSFEFVLRDYSVAVGFYGHQHSYGRTCPLYDGRCAAEGEATVHLVVGMAGYSLTKHIEPMDYMVFQENTVYGFVHFTIHNDSVLTGKFVDANTTDIVDEFTVLNPYTFGG